MALEFSCNRCINTPAPGLDDILDLAEAAGVVGLSPAALAEAADGGQVAHRKTGAGTYLFVRQDLDTLTR